MEGETKYEVDDELDIVASVTFYTIQCMLVFPAIYVNILVLQMLKREEFSFSLELKIYAIHNILETIFGLANQGLLKFAFPASINIGDWYCHVGSVLMAFGMWRGALHSLTLSLYRYVYIVYKEQIISDEQRQRIMWIISIVKWTIVSAFTIKFVIFNKDELVLFWTSVCNGNVLNQSARLVNGTQYMEMLFERVFYRIEKDNRTLITIFGAVTGNLAYALKAFCVIIDVFIVVTCSNLLEGLLYYRVAKYMET